MKKVDKSKKPRNNNACIVVCKAGVDPSKNSKQIAKLPHVDKGKFFIQCKNELYSNCIDNRPTFEPFCKMPLDQQNLLK